MSEEKEKPAADGEGDQSSRRSISLQERMDVVDYLRGRKDPVVADTKVEAARIVSAACGVEVTANQLDYLIEQLPKLELSKKIQVGPPNFEAMLARQEKLSKDIADYAIAIERYAESLNAIEARLNAIESEMNPV